MMGTAAVLGVLLVWTLGTAAAAWAMWRTVKTHRKVYGLILLNGLYLVGVFVLYALCRGGR